MRREVASPAARGRESARARWEALSLGEVQEASSGHGAAPRECEVQRLSALIRRRPSSAQRRQKMSAISSVRSRERRLRMALKLSTSMSRSRLDSASGGT